MFQDIFLRPVITYSMFSILATGDPLQTAMTKISVRKGTYDHRPSKQCGFCIELGGPVEGGQQMISHQSVFVVVVNHEFRSRKDVEPVTDGLTNM